MTDLLKGFGIAITRPLDQAKNLSAAIEQQGGNSILFPLIAISPLSDYSTFDEKISELTQADWAIFISSNAVDNAMPRIIKHYGIVPDKLKFAAIGPQTAKQLASYGVQHVLIPHERFDSEALLALSEMHAVNHQRIIIFRGIGGRELLAETLQQRGAQLDFAECYQRVNPQINCKLLDQLWQENQCHALVVTSSEAMRNLLAMTHQGNDEWIRNIAICVNHARIAEEASAAGLEVYIASAPGDASMLSCLQQALQKKLHLPLK